MKTSITLIILIVINTSVIISEPITNLIKGINIWWFLAFELCLILGYFINKTIKDLRTHCEINCNNLKLYIVKGNEKT